MKTLLIFFLFSFSFVFGTSDLRDPFNFPVTKEIKSKKLIKTSGNIKLVAISKFENKYGAIVEYKGNSKTVFVNDTYNGFLVSKIFINSIVLSKDNKNIKLFIS